MEIKFANQNCKINHLMLADKDIAADPGDVCKFTGMTCTQTQSIRGTHYHGYILDGIGEEGFWVERYFDFSPGGPLYVGHFLTEMHRAIVTTDTLLSLPVKPQITPLADWSEELWIYTTN